MKLHLQQYKQNRDDQYFKKYIHPYFESIIFKAILNFGIQYRPDVEDIKAEVMFRLLDKVFKYDLNDIRNIDYFTFIIARNSIANYLKKQNNHKKRMYYADLQTFFNV